MKRRHLAIPAVLCFFVCLGYVASVKEGFVEVNSMTGSIRTKDRRSYVFTAPWTVQNTWVAESATRQGIPTGGGWQFISKTTATAFWKQYASARSPASYPPSAIMPEDMGLESQAEIDAFTLEFVSADEARRGEMLSGHQ